MTNTNTRVGAKAINRHVDEREFVDWIEAGRSVAVDQLASGRLDVFPIARDATGRFSQRCALEGVNPFKQGLPEFYWQAYKAGMITFNEYTERMFTS